LLHLVLGCLPFVGASPNIGKDLLRPIDRPWTRESQVLLNFDARDDVELDEVLQHDGGCRLGGRLEGNNDVVDRVEALHRVFTDADHVLDDRPQPTSFLLVRLFRALVPVGAVELKDQRQ
jgi:hypothetical protein